MPSFTSTHPPSSLQSPHCCPWPCVLSLSFLSFLLNPATLPNASLAPQSCLPALSLRCFGLNYKQLILLFFFFWFLFDLLFPALNFSSMYYLGFLVLTVQLTGAEPNNWEVNFFPTILRPQGRNPPRGSFRVSFELEKERLNFPSGLRYASGQCDLLASVDLIDAIRKSFLFFFFQKAENHWEDRFRHPDWQLGAA